METERLDQRYVNGLTLIGIALAATGLLHVPIESLNDVFLSIGALLLLFLGLYVIMPSKSHRQDFKTGMQAEKIEVEKFRRLILEMYDGFPNYRYFGMVEDVIKSEKDRKRLIKHGFLIKEKTNKGEHYSLGPNALSLVSSWKTEELTKNVRKLTWLLVVLTASLLALAIIPIIFS